MMMMRALLPQSFHPSNVSMNIASGNGSLLRSSSRCRTGSGSGSISISGGGNSSIRILNGGACSNIYSTCTRKRKLSYRHLVLLEDIRHYSSSVNISASRVTTSTTRVTSSGKSSGSGYHNEFNYTNDNSDNNGNGISDEVTELINEYSQRPQTSVSLQTLTRTGKGELLNGVNGMYGRDNKGVGEEKDDDDVQIFGQLQSYPQYNNENYYSSYSTPSYSSSSYSSSSSQASQEILDQVASFIHHEMPIRLARRIKDLEQVPYLSQMPSVQSVKDIYISSFLTLINEPNPGHGDDYDNLTGTCNAREALFARKLELLYERHSGVLVQMARGAYQLREMIHKGEIQLSGDGDNQTTLNFEHLHECHAFLDRFYMSRIGIRVLAGQYLALRRPPPGGLGGGYIGLIYQHTSPYEIIQQAITDASYMCEQQYGPGNVPQVIVQGRLDLTFAYIPTHLHYIILELLKNAMRSTVEHHNGMGVGDSARKCKWPPIEVIVSDGFFNEDVVIKVADEGGGIPRSNMNKIWSYLYTTADPSVQDGLRLDGTGSDTDDHSVDAPLAGLGYGLPISRSYARYFGGDVSINSMEGYGTDAFVHLRRLGDSQEPLPV